ncbi:MAG: Ldh family oxidoreductase [Ruminococcaceae bacterium]|nr:Ldh family oxidoreductase [Oscillospiraceae bacterium]
MIISYEQERNLTKKLLAARGMSEEDADLVGAVVTHSDFTGVYSHGMSRITTYLRQLEKGALNPRPTLKKTADNKAAITFDCDNGSGIVSVCQVYDQVLERAREYGIAIGTGMHSANIGCGAYYGVRASEDDVICLVLSNTITAMAPYGGADKLIGTNPIVMSAPALEEYPLVLDMATSGVALGKVIAYAREGKEIPLGWAKDIDGNLTTNAREAHTVLPFGEHKGYGLAVMVDALGAVLAGAEVGSKIGRWECDEKENTGFVVIVIDPAFFMPIDVFKKSLDAYIRVIKHSRPAVGVKEIFMPGEIEYRKLEENKKTGIEVPTELAKELCRIATNLGIISEGEDFEALVAAVS